MQQSEWEIIKKNINAIYDILKILADKLEELDKRTERRK